jgi:hypothetical protein
VRVEGQTMRLDLPVRVPELTLRLADVKPRGITVDGEPLTRVTARSAFETGTFLVDGDVTLAAFDPMEREAKVEVSM